MEMTNEKISLLEKISFSIKKESYVIALFTSRVEVGSCYYMSDQEGIQFSFDISKEDWNTILQLHIFNDEKEFRAVRRFNQSRKESNGCLCIEKTDQDKEDMIEQKLMLIPGRWDINCMSPVFLKVFNYITYNENGMIQTEDYRLVSLVDKDGKEVRENEKQ